MASSSVSHFDPSNCRSLDKSSGCKWPTGLSFFSSRHPLSCISADGYRRPSADKRMVLSASANSVSLLAMSSAWISTDATPFRLSAFLQLTFNFFLGFRGQFTPFKFRVSAWAFFLIRVSFWVCSFWGFELCLSLGLLLLGLRPLNFLLLGFRYPFIPFEDRGFSF